MQPCRWVCEQERGPHPHPACAQHGAACRWQPKPAAAPHSLAPFAFLHLFCIPANPFRGSPLATMVALAALRAPVALRSTTSVRSQRRRAGVVRASAEEEKEVQQGTVFYKGNALSESEVRLSLPHHTAMSPQRTKAMGERAAPPVWLRCGARGRRPAAAAAAVAAPAAGQLEPDPTTLWWSAHALPCSGRRRLQRASSPPPLPTTLWPRRPCLALRPCPWARWAWQALWLPHLHQFGSARGAAQAGGRQQGARRRRLHAGRPAAPAPPRWHAARSCPHLRPAPPHPRHPRPLCFRSLPRSSWPSPALPPS